MIHTKFGINQTCALGDVKNMFFKKIKMTTNLIRQTLMVLEANLYSEYRWISAPDFVSYSLSSIWSRLLITGENFMLTTYNLTGICKNIFEE